METHGSDGPRGPHEINRPFEQEWGTFINEVRTALPGVQLLFAFLLSVPFSDRFAHLQGLARNVYFVSFLLTMAAVAFLIAPSVYHRLHWRRTVEDKEEMFLTCNRLAIVGEVLLAAAMTTAAFVIAQFMFNAATAWILTAAAFGLFGWLWFGLPLSRRLREISERRP